MPKKRRRYDKFLLSKEHARLIVKRITLIGVDLMMLLEDYDIDHGAVEDDIMSLQGYIGRLMKMLHAKYRYEAKKKLAAEEAEKVSRPRKNV